MINAISGESGFRMNVASARRVNPEVSLAKGAAMLPASLPGLERRRLQAYLAIMLGDIAMLLAAFTLGGYLYLGRAGIEMGWVLGQLVVPLFLTVALYNNAYSLQTLTSAGYGMTRALIALGLSSALVIFVTFYTKSSLEFSRVTFTLGVLLSAFALPWLRAQMRAFVRWRCGSAVLNELVIADGGPPVDMPWVRQIDAEKLSIVPDRSDPVALDRIGLLLRNVDRVIVSCPPERREAWAMIFKGAGIDGEVLDDTIVLLGAKGARQVAGHGLLQVSVGPLGLRSRAMKRLFDIVVATVAIVVISPVLAVVALLVMMEDGGPALFVQRRMGQGNTFFGMYKFRSMSVGRNDDHGERSTSRGDDRITRIGRFIRRTSIDELPQLFNVLRGDMSIVGPRPHAIGSQAGDKLFWEVDSRYWLRHALKPGMTGLAQVRGLRGATDHESDLAGRLNADLEYLNGWSIWRDITIFFATLRVVVHDKAY
jgi:lipopolysaccharide/colanic/teichoic acid biosynthesis glycosyltransferase